MQKDAYFTIVLGSITSRCSWKWALTRGGSKTGGSLNWETAEIEPTIVSTTLLIGLNIKFYEISSKAACIF